MYWNELLNYKSLIKNIFNIELDLFFVSPSLSIMNAIEVGIFSFENLNKFSFLKKKKFYYLLNTNDNISLTKFGLKNKEDSFIVYQGHHGNSIALSSNVILPTPTFLEKTGHFVTLQGYFEKASSYLTPLGFAQSDLEIFKVLSKRLNLVNFLKINFELLQNYNYLFRLNSNLPYLVISKNFYKINDINFYNKKFFVLNPHIFNYWMTDPITSNSMTMALTSKYLDSLHNFEK
jgi:NADH dehydrogenase/NADH:ubiquinone oxidoreductase subunit G